jgi:hypothetical protein
MVRPKSKINNQEYSKKISKYHRSSWPIRKLVSIIDLLFYGECHKNSRNDANFYAEWYPDRYHPPHNFFVRIEMSLREYGQFTKKTVDGN